MSISRPTIKRLFAKSNNQCAFPKCAAPIIVNGVVVGEICHIRARRKNGPRYDSSLSLKDKDDYPNLLLLCRTCHKRIDSDEATFTPELLAEIKALHEANGICEITPEVARDALLLIDSKQNSQRVTAKSSGNGVSIAVNGDVNAPISVKPTRERRAPKSKYPSNAIGADANLAGYVDYLFGLAVDYWKGVESMTPGRLGRKIKTKFRLKTRTRHHLPVERFNELVDFIIQDILIPSPVGKKHVRDGTKLCSSFNEWRGL
ncbi:HNH endonuclease [Ruficoccus amylovorans]|uniref:HNH endonuclease n=1 Tax=Ruficoccus amylovorans TaxID=1804625 RepID=A0A842HDI8_9BACT|nr:HNH endonuclease signature motif containing protein [Ruficoccus amylovorans]MBC2593746.1 HNH endonuclease [Ruficoccus amylovorans]